MSATEDGTKLPRPRSQRQARAPSRGPAGRLAIAPRGERRQTLNQDFWRFDGIPRDHIALQCPGAPHLSYAELDRSADDWAGRLAALAGGAPVLAALELATHPSSIAAYLGLLRAAIPVLIVEPGTLHAGNPLVAAWQPELQILATPDGAQALMRGTPGSHAAPHPDLRVLLSTSGSTGDPKLVRLSARNIGSNAAAIAEYLTITPQDRAATTLPLYYSYGLSVLNSYLAAGASLLLTTRSVTDRAFWDEARAHRVTSLALVPHQFELLDHGGFDPAALPDLRYVTQAGGKMAPALVRKFHQIGRKANWDLVVMYGQTEAAPRIAYVPPALLDQAADTIGQAIPGGRIWLADEGGREIRAANVPGELVYQGPNVMMGYAVTRADLARGAELDSLRTGDIAERTPDGLYRLVGRTRRFVKLYGLRLSLDQVEAMLRDQGIAAQAVAAEDTLVLLHHDPDQGEAARRAVETAYNLPSAGILAAHLADLPLLSSGKVDMRALADLAALAAARDGSRRAGRLDSLEDILKRATRRERVSPQDSFVSLGGDSLSYLQMQLALEERLGHAPAGWETMPLSKLSRLSAVANRDDTNRSHVRFDVILRLLAIFLVVGQHASDYNFFGGTWMLVVLVGYSAARFQSQLIVQARPLRLGFNLLYPILPIYFALMALYAFTRGQVPATYWPLLGNYHIFDKGKFVEVYWFVNLYAQLVLTMMLVASIGPLRRALRGSPFGAVAVALIAVTAVNLAVLVVYGPAQAKTAVFPVAHIASWGYLENLPLFLLGWLLYVRRNALQRFTAMVLALVTVAVFATTDASLHTLAWLVFCLTALLMDIELLVEKSLARLLNTVASATMFIYVTHQVLIHAIFQIGWNDQVELVASWIAAFTFGVLAKVLFDRLDPLLLWMNRSANRERRAATNPGMAPRA